METEDFFWKLHSNLQLLRHSLHCDSKLYHVLLMTLKSKVLLSQSKNSEDKK